MSKKILLCLHGWGGSKESFTELRAALKGSDLEILSPDLPGFGDEPEPKKPWTTDDYVEWVVEWLQKTEGRDQKIYLLGHSHGGRIAIKIAAGKKIPIAHLYLCASAGIRHVRHLKRIIGLTLAKSGKAVLSIPGMKSLQPIGKKFLYKLVRVHDYEKASPIMRQTLINVTEEDLRLLLPHITVPTDIFWGTADTMTPVSDGHLMKKRIKGSALHVYPGVKHRVNREKADEIAAVIKATL